MQTAKKCGFPLTNHLRRYTTSSRLGTQIYKAMIEQYDRAEALLNAEEDWLHDCKGDGKVRAEHRGATKADASAVPETVVATAQRSRVL